MLPILEKKVSAPLATLIVGIVWVIWQTAHGIIAGNSHQSMSFIWFAVLGLALSYWLSMVYDATRAVMFCIDQMAALLKMASEQVLEEQKEMTKTLVLYDDKGKEVMSADFVNNGEINMDDVETLSRFSTKFEIKDHKNEVLESGSITPNAKEEIKEAARKHNPKKDKSLTERIKDKKEQSQKKQKDKNRQREKTKKKSRDTSL